MKEEDLEYYVESYNDSPKINKKFTKIEKIILIILISIIILLICSTILCIIQVKNIKNYDNNESNPQALYEEEEEKEIIPENHSQHNLDTIKVNNSHDSPFKGLYKEKKSDISYANDNNIIINTFKKGGKNYIEKIGI